MIRWRCSATQVRGEESISLVHPRPIAINGRFLSQPVTGVQRYAREVVYAIDTMLASGELERPQAPVDILIPPGVSLSSPFRVLRVRTVGRGTGQLWEQCVLPFFCRGSLLFTPSGGSPLLHPDHVFTIPDAGVFATPAAYSKTYRTWYQQHHRAAARNTRLRLLTVSEFSRRELTKWLRIDGSRIAVTPLGHEHVLVGEPDPAVLASLAIAPQRYILGVGSANPNKNFAGLLAAFRRMRQTPGMEGLRLVVVGGVNARIFSGEPDSEPGVIRSGFLSDASLRALYAHAACLVFPSLYEGFGLPPLEAMALGCPVVCSRAASLPEVCGDAAVYFNPRSIDDIAEKVVQLLLDPGRRTRLVEQGYARSRQFSWRRTAQLTWDALLEASHR